MFIQPLLAIQENMYLFIYSINKTEDDFIRCTIEVLRRLGGITETLLTDNMSAIADTRNGKKKVHAKITQFFKDLEIEIKLAKIKMPQKGKIENSNKFVKWILPYDYDIDSEDELINLIKNVICSQANNEINQGTMIPPAALFKKEKEYLRPLPNRIMLESYLSEHYRAHVAGTMLFYYKGSRYFVPPSFINKTVDIYPIGSEIYVYYNSKLVTKHTISQNLINYNDNHYIDGLSIRIGDKNDIDIEGVVADNLKRFGGLGKK